MYPAKHKQSPAAVLPASELVCAGHAVQMPVPVVALYVPAPHAEHATPSVSAVYPATHEQSPAAVLPASELVCAGHAVQMPAPAVALYVPAPHAEHATPSVSAVYPATHEQSPAAVLPAAVCTCIHYALRSGHN